MRQDSSRSVCPVRANAGILLVAIIALCVALSSGCVTAAAAQTVNLPVTIEYPLLQSLLINKAFRDKNESVTLLNEGGGCIYLALAHPRVREDKGYIRLEVEVVVHAGTPLVDRCLMPAEWRGYLVLYQRPQINSRTWQLSFKSYQSSLLDRNQRQVQIADVLWQLIESKVFQYLDAIAIDLAPPVNNLKAFLFPLFPPQVQQQTKTMLDSLRVGEVVLRPEAVTVQIQADVREVYRPEDDHMTVVLKAKELEEVVAVWEQWDALLSFLVTTMAKDVLTPDERRLLRDVLLETRYAFVENLGNQSVTHDFVREQFASAWKQLAPIFRNHMTPDASEQKLGYLSFFTAADALTVLDGLGPTFGIEVSRNGLLRLAGMLSDAPDVLRYAPGINLDLQRLFEMEVAPLQAPDPGPEPVPPPSPPSVPPPGPPVPQEPPSSPAAPSSAVPITEPRPGPQAPLVPPVLPGEIIEEELPPIPPGEIIEEELPPLPTVPQGPLSRLWDFLCPPLYAAESKTTGDLLRWRVPDTGIDGYVRQVVRLLEAQARTTLQHNDIPRDFVTTYHTMIPAIAWQESCFRQFVVLNNKLTCLLSSNNSSVGLMQVNMRVWRGLYDQERLRWDIFYNAAAGSEIATMYLKDYALRERKGEKRPDNVTIARLVYAMYHGGPAQYKKFFERERGGKLSDVDRLFKEKFTWVANADWEKINRCLGEGEAP
ncbi:MAG: hypothetical protein BWK76_24020 [Desulfobulbaceae bacterium A2]|nr:MAG: hypothetical protein BWK76_24020 [Desulfobulbaceae bacterium A2]